MLSQRLRSPGILDATPLLHAGYRCCAACAFAHLYTSFPNWRRREVCAKDNKECRVMIPYGKCLVNYSKEGEYLSLTISFDHDMIDGAPAARFTQRFLPHSVVEHREHVYSNLRLERKRPYRECK